MAEVRWERMFPDQLNKRFEQCPVVYFSYGLCEPHGPHNTLGLDTLKAHGICCRAAQTHGGIVAPPDYWHIHEMGAFANWAAMSIGEAKPWLTAVPPWIHFKNVCYHVRAADALDFEAALLVTGHYGPNWQDLKTLVQILQPHFAMRLYALPDFEANYPGFDKDEKTVGDHAGKVETSLLWAVEPTCVDMSRLPEAAKPDSHFATGDDAELSNKRTGERMVDDQVRWLGQKAHHLRAAYQSTAPTQRKPVSFEAIEHIWYNEVEPRLTTFKTMLPPDADEVPENSRWRLNFKCAFVTNDKYEERNFK